MKIAVIDDSSSCLMMLAGLCISLGHEVFSFRHPLVAIEKIRDINPDVVVCDYLMFDMLGVDVINNLRENGSNATMILSTSMSDASLINFCENSNIIFLPKPLDIELLREVLSRI